MKKKKLFSFLKTNERKIFCIGLGKTGTTSIKRFYQSHDLVVGNQQEGEKLFDYYLKRNFKPVINYSKKSEAFQDVPFSLPFTFQVLDQYFDNAFFIHTVRNNAEEWYDSLVRFQSKRLTNGKRVPSKQDLLNDPYLYKGYGWKVTKSLYGTGDDDPYNKDRLLAFYKCHNRLIDDYFRYKENCIKINVAKDEDYLRLCEFLNLQPKAERFPWENRSR